MSDKQALLREIDEWFVRPWSRKTSANEAVDLLTRCHAIISALSALPKQRFEFPNRDDYCCFDGDFCHMGDKSKCDRACVRHGTPAAPPAAEPKRDWQVCNKHSWLARNPCPQCAEQKQQTDDSLPASVGGAAAPIDEQVERAFQMLEINGVPRARAKTVGNGIDVLATRFGKEIATLTAERDALALGYGKATAERDRALEALRELIAIRDLVEDPPPEDHIDGRDCPACQAMIDFDNREQAAWKQAKALAAISP